MIEAARANQPAPIYDTREALHPRRLTRDQYHQQMSELIEAAQAQKQRAQDTQAELRYREQRLRQDRLDLQNQQLLQARPAPLNCWPALPGQPVMCY